MARKQDLQQEVYKRFLKAADLMDTKRYSINKATKEAGISKNTFRRMNEERENYVSPVYKTNKKGKSAIDSYEVSKKHAHKKAPALVRDQSGEPTHVQLDVDKKYASILGSYWNKIDQLEQTGNADFSSFPDTIYDLHGDAYTLVKGIDDLLLFLHMQPDGYRSQITQQFHSEKRTLA